MSDKEKGETGANGAASRLVWLARDAARLIGLAEFLPKQQSVGLHSKGTSINQSQE
ncbi:hypothetical protein [Ensifer sesbaniae]|uniref:hypothetical protein n=1 Tax=Ensifer sesbaniae TaxID=1214071 RepID=UPI0015690556|nr:hypothetical protein [Ensifer sesbaniae]